MQITNDLNSSSLATSDSVELSAPKPSTPIAPSQSQQISSPKLKPRDRSDVQRIETRERDQVQRSKDFLTEARRTEAELEQLLHVESQKLAHAIADAPYRFRELVVEKVEAYGYGAYDDLKAHNDQIRALWGFDD